MESLACRVLVDDCVRCLLFVVSVLLVVRCCLVCVASYVVVWCVLFRGSLFVVHCLLFGTC